MDKDELINYIKKNEKPIRPEVDTYTRMIGEKMIDLLDEYKKTE